MRKRRVQARGRGSLNPKVSFLNVTAGCTPSYTLNYDDAYDHYYYHIKNYALLPLPHTDYALRTE